MYTPEQIRAAGIAGEISSIDVEHLIKILELETNEEKGVNSSDFKELLYIVGRMCGLVNEVGNKGYTLATNVYKNQISKIAEKY